MAKPAWALRRNIRRSLYKVVKDRFDQAGLFSGRYHNVTGYGDPLFDPTGLDSRKASLQRWVLLSVPTCGVGRKLPTLLQADFYTRLGTYDQTNTTAGQDPYSDDLDDMCDDFGGIWYPSDAGVKVLDFAVPAMPTDTGMVMLAQIAQGKGFGSPSDESPVGFDRGLFFKSVTWSFWNVQSDMQDQPIYFDASPDGY